MFTCCGCDGVKMNAERNNEFESDKNAVTDQPKTEETRQQSANSDIRIEISDNDDDEVFCEGTGPPVKLADNLGTPHNKSQGVNHFGACDRFLRWIKNRINY